MYNKLFAKILDSSIWLESLQVRIVWVTFLAAMDQDGMVPLSGVGNVALRARVTEQEAADAIRCLEGPDNKNPDQDHEGRRIERIPGMGWVVINAKKYRDIVTAEVSRTATRERVARFRDKKRKGGNANVTPANDLVTSSDAVSVSVSTAEAAPLPLKPAASPQPDPAEQEITSQEPANPAALIEVALAPFVRWHSKDEVGTAANLATIHQVERMVGRAATLSLAERAAAAKGEQVYPEALMALALKLQAKKSAATAAPANPEGLKSQMEMRRLIRDNSDLNCPALWRGANAHGQAFGIADNATLERAAYENPGHPASLQKLILAERCRLAAEGKP